MERKQQNRVPSMKGPNSECCNVAQNQTEVERRGEFNDFIVLESKAFYTLELVTKGNEIVK